MLTQNQIQQTILSAQLTMANLVEANRLLLAGGAKKSSLDWKDAQWFYLNIKALLRQYNLQDYTSNGTVAVYECLQSKIGIDTTVNTIDPNYQGSSTTIVNNGGFVGTNVVRGIIPFTNVNPVQLLNYNTTYKQLYGNNLITLDIFLNGYTEDEQTPPTIVYAISNDPTTDIISITWDYPAPVSGYILIAGVVPISGTPAAGGGGSVTFTFTEANLVDDGNGGFYLPMMLPTGKRPSYTESNNVEIKANYNNNYSPGRLYGFANNLTQTITVLVI